MGRLGVSAKGKAPAPRFRPFQAAIAALSEGGNGLFKKGSCSPPATTSFVSYSEAGNIHQALNEVRIGTSSTSSSMARSSQGSSEKLRVSQMETQADVCVANSTSSSSVFIVRVK